MRNIGHVSGRKDKEALIQESLDVPYFQQAARYTFDPFKVFHITACYALKNIPATLPAGAKYTERTLENLFKKLDDLCAASGATLEDKMELSWLAGTDADTLYVVNRILERSFDCGVGAKTICKHVSGIPTHDIMLCDNDLSRLQKYAGGNPQEVIWQDKLDGVRTWAQVTAPNHIAYTSRRGKTFANFGKFDEHLGILAALIRSFCKVPTGSRIIFDGEVISKDRQFDKFLGNVMRQEGSDTTDFQFYIFDVIVEGKEKELRLSDRLEILSQVTKAAPSEDVILLPWQKLKSWDEISTLLTDAVTRGEEGGVCKWLSGLYEYKRSGHWCKIKKITYNSGEECLEADVPVVGKIEGTKKHAGTLGALLIDFNGVRVKVGSGYSDAQRAQFWQSMPTRITVKYQEVTANGSLRFPVFCRDRTEA